MSDEASKEDDEVLHFMRVLNAFKAYKKVCLRKLSSCEDDFSKLSEEHKQLLSGHRKVFEDTKVCVDFNMVVINEIVNSCQAMFENKNYKEHDFHVQHTSFDSDKVRSTLKQIARDWSIEGQAEREDSYQPIIDAITKWKPISGEDSDITILVPGCGLGRLAWELARLGYCCQGNEFSFYMLFTSNFIINRCGSYDECDDGDYHQYTIHPFIDNRNNNLRWQDAMKPVKFPDVNPASLPYQDRFSMTAGDFLEVYQAEGSWDCIATCFFIDTAHNIVEYIERIYKILKPGGMWVNFGPLLYHYSGISTSIELSLEEVMEIIKKVGFNIKEERRKTTTYTCNSSSMLTYQYNCSFIVAFKP